MKISKKLVLNIFVSLVILVLLLKFAKLDPVAFFDQVKSVNVFWLAMSSLAFLIQIMTNSYRWNLLTKLLDYPLKYIRALGWYFQGAFSNNFFPTNLGGDALRAYYLGKDKKDWLRAGGTVLMERVLGFLMLIFNIPVGLAFLYFSPVYERIPVLIIYAAWLLFASTVIGVLSYKLWTKIPFGPIQKLRFAIDEYTKCHKSISKVVLWTFITHVFLITANICAARAVGIGFYDVPAWYWFLLLPVAILVSFLIPSMKGMGAKEASYVYFLGLLGIQSEKALAVSFVILAAMMISSLPGFIGVMSRLEKKVRAVSRAKA